MESRRLIIREPDQADFETLFAIHADSRTNRYNPGWTETKRQDFRRFFDYVIDHHQKFGFGYYALQDKEDMQVFGLCGLRFINFNDGKVLNLYYRIDPTKTRKGFVKEAARQIIDFVLEKTNHQYQVLVLTREDNLPSRKTAESLGFKYHPEFDDLDGKGNVYYFYCKGQG